MRILSSAIVEILKAEGRPVKRSQLLQRLAVKANVFDAHIQLLVQHGVVTVERVQSAGWGARGYTTYQWTGSTLDVSSLTVKQTTLPTPSTQRPHHMPRSKCCWCEKVLLGQSIGRPRLFCDRNCREHYQTALRSQIGRAFMRAPRHAWSTIAMYLVAADLSSRGTLHWPPGGVSAGTLLLQYRDGATHTVRVFVAKDKVPASRYVDEVGTISATVHPDGYITYAPAFPTEKEAAPDDDESSGAEEGADETISGRLPGR